MAPKIITRNGRAQTDHPEAGYQLENGQDEALHAEAGPQHAGELQDGVGHQPTAGSQHPQDQLEDQDCITISDDENETDVEVETKERTKEVCRKRKVSSEPKKPQNKRIRSEVSDDDCEVTFHSKKTLSGYQVFLDTEADLLPRKASSKSIDSKSKKVNCEDSENECEVLFESLNQSNSMSGSPIRSTLSNNPIRSPSRRYSRESEVIAEKPKSPHATIEPKNGDLSLRYSKESEVIVYDDYEDYIRDQESQRIERAQESEEIGQRHQSRSSTSSYSDNEDESFELFSQRLNTRLFGNLEPESFESFCERMNIPSREDSDDVRSPSVSTSSSMVATHEDEDDLGDDDIWTT